MQNIHPNCMQILKQETLIVHSNLWARKTMHNAMGRLKCNFLNQCANMVRFCESCIELRSGTQIMSFLYSHPDVVIYICLSVT